MRGFKGKTCETDLYLVWFLRNNMVDRFRLFSFCAELEFSATTEVVQQINMNRTSSIPTKRSSYRDSRCDSEPLRLLLAEHSSLLHSDVEMPAIRMAHRDRTQVTVVGFLLICSTAFGVLNSSYILKNEADRDMS
jgi:hypothetical protein